VVAVESISKSRIGVVVAAIREESERRFFYLEMLWSNTSDLANGITVLGRSGGRRGLPTLAYGQSDAQHFRYGILAYSIFVAYKK
jgi:hypothetical protein